MKQVYDQTLATGKTPEYNSSLSAQTKPNSSLLMHSIKMKEKHFKQKDRDK